MNVQIIRSDVGTSSGAVEPAADHVRRISFGSLSTKIAGGIVGSTAAARPIGLRMNEGPITTRGSRPRTPHHDRMPDDASVTRPFNGTRPPRAVTPERPVAGVVEARMRTTLPPTWTIRPTTPRTGPTTSTRTSFSSNGRMPSVAGAVRVGPRSRRPCCAPLTPITHERFGLESQSDRAWPAGACSETPRGI